MLDQYKDGALVETLQLSASKRVYKVGRQAGFADVVLAPALGVASAFARLLRRDATETPLADPPLGSRPKWRATSGSERNLRPSAETKYVSEVPAELPVFRVSLRACQPESASEVPPHAMTYSTHARSRCADRSSSLRVSTTREFGSGIARDLR